MSVSEEDDPEGQLRHEQEYRFIHAAKVKRVAVDEQKRASELQVFSVLLLLGLQWDGNLIFFLGLEFFNN